MKNKHSQIHNKLIEKLEPEWRKRLGKGWKGSHFENTGELSNKHNSLELIS